ncbi:hypothetical protein [Desulfoscipio gibsoniae]|uniref:Uncharacterized protein n=1 Tax=Desulfoscipio gibsoniae DSM 7213 TaxID=767817 RepID=R4KJH5_9FIRM|nr:hypothetical protein [Desulfoscipio gibsoniae]AGL01767.1 hypothetical protein Desgi_2351 [Desulfoscipio gibsoniae DSM 7213]
MTKAVKLLLRFGGIALIGVAMLGGLPGPYPTLMGIAGVVLFFAAGST